MKAMVYDRYGPVDEVLAAKEIEPPVVADDDVLIRVAAAGVDPGVWHVVTGRPQAIRLYLGLRRPKWGVPGMAVAGVVEAVGRNVTRFRPGDEVYGEADGTYAELVRTRHDRVAAKPANLTAMRAAAIPISATTALQALRDMGKVQAGQRVLVIGAGGGIGTFAVQLAKVFGAHVTGVCGPSKVDLVWSIGADEVIDRTREDIVDGHYDLVVDTVGTLPLSRLRRALNRRGTLVLVGAVEDGAWIGGLARTLKAFTWSPFVSQRLRALISVTRGGDLEVLRELVEAGKVTPVIERTYALTEAREAIAHMMSGQVRGKLVLTV